MVVSFIRGKLGCSRHGAGPRHVLDEQSASFWLLAQCCRAFTIGTMRSLSACMPGLVLLLGVSGCAAYDPPVQGDHNTDRYKADLEACRTSSTEAVRLKNADTPTTWILSPFTGPPAVRAAIRTCMTTKGYVVGKTGN
jgi:hypothetical protein